MKKNANDFENEWDQAESEEKLTLQVEVKSNRHWCYECSMESMFKKCPECETDCIPYDRNLLFDNHIKPTIDKLSDLINDLEDGKMNKWSIEKVEIFCNRIQKAYYDIKKTNP